MKKPNNDWIGIDDVSLKQYENEKILIYVYDTVKVAVYSVDNSPFTDDNGNEYQYSHWFSDEFGDFIAEIDEVNFWQPLPKAPKRNIRIMSMFNWLRQRRYSMSIGNNNITGSITMTLGTDVQDGGWINADTPPDDNHYVWVSYKPIRKSYPNNIDRPRRYCMGFYNLETKRWIVSDADRLLNYVCEVTHWQKIIPPKE